MAIVLYSISVSSQSATIQADKNLYNLEENVIVEITANNLKEYSLYIDDGNNKIKYFGEIGSKIEILARDLGLGEFSVYLYKDNQEIDSTSFIISKIKPISKSTDPLAEDSTEEEGVNPSSSISLANQQVAEINKPVKWVKNISGKEVIIHKNAVNVKIKDSSEIMIQNYKEEESFSIALDTDETSGRKIIFDVEDTYTVEYETEAPVVKEERLTNYKKRVTISSSTHYQNVKTYVDIEEREQEVILYIVNDDGTRDLFYVAKLDTDNNGLIDRLEWVTPHLSDRSFDVEFKILNIQSYPTLYGNWQVNFTTNGSANLSIRAIEDTTWSNDSEDFDLEFLQISCGSSVKEYEWINGAVYLDNYSCSEVGSEVSKVFTLGKHVLEFNFGGQIAKAYNRVGGGGVQRGGVSGTGSRLTDTLPNVIDPSSSFVLFTSNTNDATPDDNQFTPNISDSTTITFDRYDGASVSSDIRWQVVESEDLSVQRGTLTLNAGIGSSTDNINEVNLSKSFIIVYGRCSDEANTENNAGFFLANFSSSTQVYVERGNQGDCAATVNYQVVEWEGASVQSGFSSIPDNTDSVTTSIGSAVNRSNTFLVFGSASIGTDTGMDSNLIQGNISSDTQVLFRDEPGTTYASSASSIWWYVVTLPGSGVQNGAVTVGGDSNEAIANTNISSSFHVSSRWGTGGGQSYQNGEYTLNMTSGTNLFADEMTTSQDSHIVYFVVQIPQRDELPAQINYGSGVKANNTNTTIKNIFVNVSVVEENEANITFNLYDEGGSVNSTSSYSSQREITWFDLGDGVYYYNVTVVDDAGNKNATQTRKINIDTTFPLIEYFEPTLIDNSNSSKNYITINVTYIEDNFANLTFVLANNTQIINTTIIVDLFENLLNFTELGDGEYTYNVTIRDYAGNVNFTQSRSISIETIIPTINYVQTTELNNTNLSQNYIFVNVSVVEENEANITFNLYDEGGSVINRTTYYASVREITWFDLGDGVYYYNVSVYDYYSNTKESGTRSIRLDTTTPLIEYRGPTEINSSNVSRKDVVINLTYTEDNFANLTISLSNETSEINRTFVYDSLTNYLNFTELGDGSYYYNSTITDTAGNKNYTETRTIRLDTRFPLIEYGEFTEINNSNFSRSHIFVNTTINEVNFANITFDLYNQGGLINRTIYYDSTRNINFTELGDGEYTYNVTIRDYAGNVNFTVTRLIRLDSTYPQLKFSFPTKPNGSTDPSTYIMPNVSLEEIHFQNITFSLYNNTGGLTLVNRTTLTEFTNELNWSGLSNDNVIYFYNITTTDTFGNVNFTETRTLTLTPGDIAPPLINIINPGSEGINIPTNSVSFNLTLDEVGSGCYYNLNPGSGNISMDQNGVSSFGAMNNSISDGDYDIIFFCNDTSNNLANSSRNFTIDTVFPLIEYGENTAINNSNFSRIYILANVSYTEINPGSIIFRLYNVSGLVNTTVNSPSETNVVWTNLEEGFYIYNITISDLAGNDNFTKSRSIKLDRTAPEAVINLPQTISYAHSTINFSVSVNEIGEYCNYTLSDGENKTTTYTGGIEFNATNNSISDGDYVVSYFCADLSGNIGINSTSFTVDTIYPSVTIFEPINKTYNANTSLTLNYSATDINRQTCEYSIDGGQNILLNSCSNITFNTSQGQHTLNFYVNDTAGNLNNTFAITFLADSVYPLINYTNMQINNSNSSLDYLIINVSVTEINVANITYEISNSSGIINLTTYQSDTGSINFTELSNGEYSYNVTITDTAGNKNYTETRRINIDSVLPIILFLSDSQDNGTIEEKNSIFVNVSVVEENYKNISLILYNSTLGISLVNKTSYDSQILNVNWSRLNSANITYYYNVSVYDYMENINVTETRTVKLIDGTNPLLALSSPSNSTYDFNTSIPLSFTVTDLNIGSCWYNLNRGVNVTLNGCVSTNIDLAEGQHTLYLFTNDTLGRTNQTNITFVANTSLVFTGEWKVQRGAISVANTANVSIEKVDPKKSIIFQTARTSTSTPDAMQATAKFINTTLMQFQNYGGTTNVDWEVITGPNLSVQRDEQEYTTTQNNINISINTIDLSKSFVIITNRLDEPATTNANVQGYWTGALIDETTLNLQRGVTGNAGNVSWQVVEWEGASVQSGTMSTANSAIDIDLTTNINTTNSFMIFSRRISGATALSDTNIGGYVVNSTTLSFYRRRGTGTMVTEWFVVEWDRLKVQRGSTLVSGGSTISQGINQLTNLSKSFHTHTRDTSGNGETHANSIVSSRLSSTTILNYDKGTGSNNQNASWVVVEVIDIAQPQVSLLYPLNNQNITSLLVNNFNFSIQDESNIVNCTLNGNWTGQWHQNQTLINPERNQTANFSKVEFESSSYYDWNVECTDIYGNKGSNSTNFTFAAFISPQKPLLNNITQTANDGTGEVRLYWSNATDVYKYLIYSSDDLINFNYLNETFDNNYTDYNFVGNKRKFYRIAAWNPTNENFTVDSFASHVYTLRHNGNTKNWVSFPANVSYLKTANNTLNEIINASSINMWNESLQERVTCNLFSCPDILACTDTNCNFNITQGKSYEVNINSSSSQTFNWSVVGKIYSSTTIALKKNSTGFGKNWIGLISNTSLTNASSLYSSISEADAISKWDSEAQTSVGLIANPFYPFGPLYLGTDFDLIIEEGYEVSVKNGINWTQE